ncbi:acyl-CoA dehydrogenase family protein [Steroidobacter flavus]|uniref:Acyl-CoA dehydrogenase family protein n=1 Tax=Steroidobacter flavus TaxID=1842136 RepID=A0ABV8SY90_9GAMM
MDFSWTPEHLALRDSIRTVLAETLPADWDRIAREGPGSAEQTAFSRAFCPKLAARGLLVPHWPVEFGGRGASTWEHFIIGEELWAAGEPRGPQYMNVNWIGPTLMRYGSPAQQQEHLPRIAAGTVIWCQGFSEPNAGSDLASLRTRAEKVDGGYVINGSKIWTSYAAEAEFCFLLARTSADRKGGIAIFLVPMNSPGIRVQQIPALIGEGDIHEVFFHDVFVAEAQRLGGEGQGWDIITHALANERIGIPRYAFARRALDTAIGILRARGELDSISVKARAGQALAAVEAARMLVYRVVDQRAKRGADRGQGSLARWAVVSAERAVCEFVLDFVPDGLHEAAPPLLLAHHMRAIAAGLASGAAEVQLDLIAKMFLELPRERARAV